MINLLPPEQKEQIAYARRNKRLVHWAMAMTIGIAGIILVLLAGQVYISQTTKSLAKQVEDTREQLKVQKLDETQARVSSISSSLKLVVQVLSKEVLFSQLIKKIGSTLPPGTALTTLSITKVEGGIDLQFGASDYQAATQIQVNLQDPQNGIFDKADLININCASTSTSEQRYPCQVNIRAQFATNNPFLFINKTPAVQP